MSENKYYDKSAEDILNELEHELRARDTRTQSEQPVYEMQTRAFPRLQPVAPLELGRDEYHLNEFLVFWDRDFLTNAYGAILGRWPDQGGVNHYLAQLRSGGLSRVEIAGRLRYSREGRKRGVAVKGLLRSFAVATVFRIPLLGPVLRLPFYLLPQSPRTRRLDRTVGGAFSNMDHLCGVIAHEGRYLRELHHDQAATISGIEALRAEVGSLQQEVAYLREAVQDKFEQVDVQISEQCSSMEELDVRVRKDGQALLDEARRSISDQQGAVEQFVEQFRVERQKTLDGIMRQFTDQQSALDEFASSCERRLGSAEQVATLLDRRLQARDFVTSDQFDADAFYRNFEEEFRGSRESVMQRMADYPAVFEPVRTVSQEKPIVDLGCGRGELVEVLRSSGFGVRGVDGNPHMVRTGTDRGLPVMQGDIFEYLENAEPESAAGISLIHVAEHFPFEELTHLLGLCFRVLDKGGILVLETPNPDNIVMGGAWFYTDFSHVHPLRSCAVSNLLSFLGFDVQKPTLRQPYQDVVGEVNSPSELEKKWFLTGLDYCLVAVKAGQDQ